MATVTGLTADRMLEIEAASVVDGEVVGDNLILKRFDDSEINAGNVRGPQGDIGPTGATSIAIVTSATRPGAPFTGQFIYETDTKRIYVYDGAAWIYRGGMVLCTAATRPASPFEGLEIYETDTDRTYIYDGSGWVITASLGAWPTWTPTLYNNTTAVAKTVIYARYVKFGRTCIASCKLNPSATGVAGDIRITLPLTAVASPNSEYCGTMHFYDASAAIAYFGGAFIISNDRVMMIRDSASGNGAVSTAVANGDNVWMNVMYETAS